MIPSTKQHRIESTLVGEDVAMTLDANATAHLMAVLTDLYADPEAAVVREYATNARDAHVEAGTPGAIEVELPSPLRPTLVIRDYGVGLNVEDIRRIYSRYGASTKRGTNDATGMLGLGCKSALTLTDQFSLVAVKDGIRTVVSVSRNAEGAGTMKVLESVETGEPNGVEVTIPVPRDNDIADKAHDLFRFWPVESVTIDGQRPPRFPQGARITDDITAWYRHQDGAPDQCYVVMGGVPYPAPELWSRHDIPRAVSLVAEVPIGSLNFAPSREALMDTKLTRETLARVAATFNANRKTAVQEALNTATSRAEALDTWLSYFFLGGDDDTLTWKGETVPTSFTLDTLDTLNGGRMVMVGRGRRGYYRSEGQHQWVKRVDVGQAARALWFVNFTNSTFSAGMRRKLDAYLAAEGPEGATADGAILVSTPTVPHAAWINPDRVLDYAVVQRWKDPNRPAAKSTGGSGTVKGTYHVRSRDGRRDKLPMDQIDTKRPILWTEGGVWHGSREWDEVAAVMPDAQLVVLPANRVERFKRLFPQARPWREVLCERAVAWWDGLTPETQRALVSEPDRRYAELVEKGVKPEAIEDPAFKAGLEQVVIHQRATARAKGKLLRWVPADTRRAAQQPHTLDTGAYPLVHAILNTYHRISKQALAEHLTLYINAAYAARKDG